MTTVPHDVRLLLFLAINAIVLWSATRFVKRCIGASDSIQVALDGMLIWYVVQYLAIGVPGVLGMLNAPTAALVAIVCSACLLSAKRADVAATEATRADSSRVIPIALAVVIAVLAGNVFLLRYGPPIANDVLTYHLPAAAQWIQTGKLGLHETWFFNPANTYSPLAGSMFAAWAMIFTNNDVLARFDQAPALIMLFLATMRIARHLGAQPSTAAIIALGVACARPFIAQGALAKDDLFVAAFFATAVVSLTRASERVNPWRLGAAVGLFLATKYTTLLIAPALLLAIDAPRRANWRAKDYLIAITVALALFAPWYVRNAILTGNPIFPAGSMFTAARSHELVGIANVWRVLTRGYFATPPIVMIPLIVAWLAAIAFARRRVLVDPITRLCALGPPIAVALFAIFSPYAEVRFVNPAIALMFGSMAMLRNRIALACAAVLAALALATSFVPARLNELALPACILFAIALLVIGWLRYAPPMPRVRRSVALVAMLVFIGLTYVFWPAYVRRCSDDTNGHWPAVYGELANAWQVIRATAPPGATIAYANSYFTYPLMGYEFDHRIVYAPVRPRVRTLADLGWIDRPLSGEEIVEHVVALTNRDADRETWLANLRSSHAQWIFIEKKPNAPEAPELRFAASDSQQFRLIFDNPAATIFEFQPH